MKSYSAFIRGSGGVEVPVAAVMLEVDDGERRLGAVRWQWRKVNLSIKSLFYNHFMDQGYIGDVCMEPMFWFVDNFTKFLGPFFVACVCGLTASVVAIAYWIGLPYWWNKSPCVTVLLMIIGHWLLVNISFHYYMAANTHPGYPPQGTLIPEAASICKKCIAPKPPRTHHCSVCNKCILKMDHHCPWLNNCIGHYNHRYFFLYMAYMCLGVLFLIIFGFHLAYNEVWIGIEEIDEDDESLIEGHPVHFNNSGLIPLMASLGNVSLLETTELYEGRSLRQSCLMYMAFINTGVLIALGSLTLWHARLISRGETSIEANINKAETKRLAEKNKVLFMCMVLHIWGLGMDANHAHVLVMCVVKVQVPHLLNEHQTVMSLQCEITPLTCESNGVPVQNILSAYVLNLS
ncbi:hypothetical protein Cfor_12103 [Coptotermes formosanus]|uniref:Palmitoyltransferase n=1 Tax=Coptotermes formosanus TaxID=36987 RepID=A0A6L2PR78_COPFO|nr:hypothetical protein Cfor_12103 [Coptotermes formosanus]